MDELVLSFQKGESKRHYRGPVTSVELAKAAIGIPKYAAAAWRMIIRVKVTEGDRKGPTGSP